VNTLGFQVSVSIPAFEATYNEQKMSSGGGGCP
jgi:hypothetical protein